MDIFIKRLKRKDWYVCFTELISTKMENTNCDRIFTDKLVKYVRLKMPSSYLYAINNEGRVFGLSTSGNMWREFMYLGLEFKQLSAVPHFMWAIGGDRQVYVHVHGLDIPIRIKEETYENEVRVKCIIVTL